MGGICSCEIEPQHNELLLTARRQIHSISDIWKDPAPLGGENEDDLGDISFPDVSDLNG